MNKIVFNYRHGKFGRIYLIFNEYEYYSDDKFEAEEIIKTAKYHPGKAWNDAKEIKHELPKM